MPGMNPPVSSTLFCSHFSVTRDTDLCNYKSELHKWNSVETDAEIQSTLPQVELLSSYAINFSNSFTPKYSGTSVYIYEKFIPLTLSAFSALANDTFTDRKISRI